MQAAQPLPEQKAEPAPYRIIYEAAKRGQPEDKAIIDALLYKDGQENISIDVRDGEVEGTVSSRLAEEGNLKALNFLRTHYKPSERWIVYGLGKAERIEGAMEIIKTRKKSERHEYLLYLVYGLAAGGHVNAIRKIYEGSDVYSRFSLLKMMVNGLAMAKDDSMLDEAIALFTQSQKWQRISSLTFTHIIWTRSERCV